MFQILVVDDDKNTRLLLKAVLQSENYSVHTAENGEEALEVMDREHIDLVQVRRGYCGRCHDDYYQRLSAGHNAVAGHLPGRSAYHQLQLRRP